MAWISGAVCKFRQGRVSDMKGKCEERSWNILSKCQFLGAAIMFDHFLEENTQPLEWSYWKDKVKMSDGCEGRGSHPIDSQGQGLQSPTKIPMRTKSTSLETQKAGCGPALYEVPVGNGWLDMEANPDGFEINIQSLSTAEDKMTQQKILFYIVSSVTSIGMTKEGEHLYQEIKPPEVQARAQDPWMAFDVGPQDLIHSLPISRPIELNFQGLNLNYQTCA
ncbi:hypothetical protein ARMGADRAFT_1031960 [Armillaria gallica]|uniref:Uncharacterized protein n=1 Tax=Armillaria gallica TaxID=47427 RepID=A0A2H3D7U2_ARMGA|nr:hypothetical protein ARMGADRAFT_1031960 [Armillaria gallica]